MNDDLQAIQREGEAVYQALAEARERQVALAKKLGRGVVQDYELEGAEGGRRLSSLFGAHDELMVIQNMGKGCSYCTLWADGIHGVLDHLENRLAVVLVSPDDPAVQAEFAASRGWRFEMLSSRNSSFKEDLGFAADGQVMPGVSMFERQGEAIANVANDYFGPGDVYCNLWHFLGLLPAGAGGWQPRISYDA